jgi:hypothetical protein
LQPLLSSNGVQLLAFTAWPLTCCLQLFHLLPQCPNDGPQPLIGGLSSSQRSSQLLLLLLLLVVSRPLVAYKSERERSVACINAMLGL